MNYEEIMARIAAGEDEEAIVKEFTDNLNKANAELAAKREAEAEARAARARAEAELEVRKNETADMIAQLLNEYVVICGFDAPNIDHTDVRDTLDGLLELIPLFKNLNVQIMTPKASKKVGKDKPTISNDVFAEFFKSLGI
jgi:hypothetical protein